MYKIKKEFHFCSSHRLEHLPINHPCHNLHGHNYIATFYFKSEQLNQDTEFVIDFRATEKIKAYIDNTLDHKHLNDVLPCKTTSENISKFLYDRFKKEYPSLYMVEINETLKTGACYHE